MFKNLAYLLVLIIVLFEMLFNSPLIVNSVNFSLKLCINNLFPTLFPFMVLSNILMEYGFIDLSSELLKKIMNKLFKVHENTTSILILSIISGSPSNAKYIEDLLNKNIIDIKQANKILLFSHFVNPIFIINTIGITFLNSKKIGIIILISHYLGNIILGIIIRNYKPYNIKNSINITKTLNKIKNKKNNFIIILTNSITSTINTLLIILGVITTCLIITNLFNIKPPINGILEITQGLKYISLSNYSLIIKIIITTFLISFGGFSIHAQNFSILSNKKIKYIPYLLSRITHGIISSIIVYILFRIIYF